VETDPEADIAQVQQASSRTTGYDTSHWRARVGVYVSTNLGMCSGTMIGSRSVLTNGHCIASGGAVASSVWVVPGLDETYMPYGMARWTRAMMPNEWYYDGDKEHDYAVITIDRELGNYTGFAGLFRGGQITGDDFFGYGYPCDVAGFNCAQQWWLEGMVYWEGVWRVFHDAPTYDGNSGTGLWLAANPVGLIAMHRGRFSDGTPNGIRIVTPTTCDRIIAYAQAGLGDPLDPIENSSWGALGGWNGLSSAGFVAAPALVDTNDGELRLFAWTAGNGTTGNPVYAKRKTASGWLWGQTNIGGNTSGQISAVSRAPGQTDVFARDATTGSVVTKAVNSQGVWWPSAGGAWHSLNIPITESPTGLATATNELWVFASVSAGTIAIRWNGGSWPSGALQIGGNVIGPIAAVSRSPGQLDIFARERGTNRIITKARSAGAVWWPNLLSWYSGGPFAATATSEPPAVVSWGSSHLDVYGVDVSTNQVMHVWWDGSSWAGPQYLGGDPKGPVVAISRAYGQIDLFFRDRVSGSVCTKAYNVSTGWWPASPTAWRCDLLTGDVIALAAASAGVNHLEVVAQTASTTIANKWWDGAWHP